jgi:hypothetical protein
MDLRLQLPVQTPQADSSGSRCRQRIGTEQRTDASHCFGSLLFPEICTTVFMALH